MTCSASTGTRYDMVSAGAAIASLAERKATGKVIIEITG